ncbi:MAG: T9SS type A sorting domain-containing protein [Dysgonamonadaceae bacterium]|jgi:sialate O-acetylesterase|nr:T9SS type A sorting domain-containing protein [Dysgonamonadaceae bacterium]
MKRIKIILSSLLLLCSISAISAEQIEKIVGTVAKRAQVNRFGPDASDFYGFQTYWRDLNIDASQSDFNNLVLKMRVYIENFDHPGDISFIQQAGFAMIELANDMQPVDTYVQWGIKNLNLQDGWTDLYLPLTTGDRKANFDLSKPLNWFRFGFAHIPGEPDALQIRLMDVQLVDKSILVNPPDDGDPEWNTDYHVADVPYSMNNPLANGVTFSVGQGFTQNPIDASAHNPKQLHLMFDADVTEQTPGDIFVLSRVSGQIELTSTGGPDQKEMLWSIGSVDWKAGLHTYALPFSTAGKTNGDIDLSNINFIRFYAVNVPTDYTGRITVKVSGVKIVDFTNQTKLPALFGDRMMFQQNKPVNIWGSAVAGKEITVDFYKGDTKIDSKSAVTPESGKWEVTFGAQAASYDLYRFEVKEGETLIQSVNDILFGEVWLSSGQSNMALSVAGTIDGQSLMANANNDYIRFFLEPTATTAPYIPNTDIQGAYWGSGNDGMQVGKVSAVAYSMAVKLQEELNIPVGIINTAVGSSVIEAWMPAEDIENDPALRLDMNRLGLYFDEAFYPEGTNQMSSYYNLKVHPLLGYGITGMIWYQGESNSPRPQLYARELDLLKKSYERIFGFTNNDMPLIYCQVAPWVQSLENPHYLAPLAEAFYDGWAMHPETMALLPIYDTDLTYVGNGVIHPTNKTPIGKRFADAALNLVYNGGGEYTAPVFKEMTVSGDKIIVTFSHVGDGLKSTNDIEQIRGFAICGEDSVFVGAKARILSATEVEVWNERVKNPKQVTYAWATFNVTSNLANSVNIPAAPFRSDRNAGYTFYNPQDWTFADGNIWGVSAGTGTDEIVGFLPAWTQSANNATLSYDETLKSEGKASLKVAYTLSAAGNAVVEPVLTHKTVVSQLANFNTLSFDVLNPDDREKSIELLLKAADGKIYRATFVGYEGDNTQETTAIIGKTSVFRTLTFDIKTLKNQQNVTVPANNTASILQTITAIQFTVADNAAGTVYLDNVIFGFSTDQMSPLSIAKTVGELPFDVRYSNRRLHVKTDAGNPIREVSLIDMQGRIIYVKDNIDLSEYSFRTASEAGVFIARIQSEKFTAAKKIIVNLPLD